MKNSHRKHSHSAENEKGKIFILLQNIKKLKEGPFEDIKIFSKNENFEHFGS